MSTGVDARHARGRRGRQRPRGRMRGGCADRAPSKGRLCAALQWHHGNALSTPSAPPPSEASTANPSLRAALWCCARAESQRVARGGTGWEAPHRSSAPRGSRERRSARAEQRDSGRGKLQAVHSSACDMSDSAVQRGRGHKAGGRHRVQCCAVVAQGCRGEQRTAGDRRSTATLRLLPAHSTPHLPLSPLRPVLTRLSRHPGIRHPPSTASCKPCASPSLCSSACCASSRCLSVCQRRCYSGAPTSSPCRCQ